MRVGSGASRSARQPSSRDHRGGGVRTLPRVRPRPRPRGGWPRRSRPRGAAGPTPGATGFPSTRPSRRSRLTRSRGVLGGFDGCETAKVKVAERGQSLADDVCRVAAVRDAMGPVRAHPGRRQRRLGRGPGGRCAQRPRGIRHRVCGAALRVRGGAGRAADRLARSGVEVPIAADESIRKAEDPLRVAQREAADLIVVKVAPSAGCGGPSRSWGSAGCRRWSPRRSTPRWAWRPGWRSLAALPELPFACGLGTVALLEGDTAPAAWCQSGATCRCAACRPDGLLVVGGPRRRTAGNGGSSGSRAVRCRPAQVAAG